MWPLMYVCIYVCEFDLFFIKHRNHFEEDIKQKAFLHNEVHFLPCPRLESVLPLWDGALT